MQGANKIQNPFFRDSFSVYFQSIFSKMILRTVISIIGLAAIGYWAITDQNWNRSQEQDLKTFTCQGRMGFPTLYITIPCDILTGLLTPVLFFQIYCCRLPSSRRSSYHKAFFCIHSPNRTALRVCMACLDDGRPKNDLSLSVIL